MSTHKKRETVCVTRNADLAEGIALTVRGEVSIHNPSVVYPYAGLLYVVSRKWVCQKG